MQNTPTDSKRDPKETIRSLILIHRLKKPHHEGFFQGDNIKHFYLNTCQREFILSHVDFICPKELELLSQSVDTSVFYREEAYCFLLQILTGLESALVGETEIFGQFKSAWKEFENIKDHIQIGLFDYLKNIVHKSLEDAKEIRTHYLQHIGSSSYGGLVRKILKDSIEEESVFILGAGKIAKTTLPYFKDRKVFLWNRHADKIGDLIVSSVKENRENFQVLSEYEESYGWENAHHIIVCIPPDEQADSKRVELWKKFKQNLNKNSKIIHLGLQRGGNTAWESLPELVTLTDLFEMEKNQNELRQYAVKQALLACQKRAHLRFLGGHTTLPHGWEDLMSLA